MNPGFDIRITKDARADIEAIHSYVETNRSLEEADALLGRFLDKAKTLKSFPRRGPIPPEASTLAIGEFRQTFVAPYRMIYRIDGETVYVVLVADGRRDMQTLLQQRLLNR